MTDIFAEYSEYYDLLYEDKPYPQEARYIADLLAHHGGSSEGSSKVLDLACGTGRHCFELEKLGYVVEGSDPSAAMIRAANRQAQALGSRVAFHNYSFQECDRLGKKYDAVISMFSAIGYVTTHAEIVLSLRNISQLLVPGGIFIFDYWNGNAVVQDYSPVKVLRKQRAGREVLRISRTSLDRVTQVARVNFQFLCFDGDIRQREFREEHLIRYFFFQEMEAYLGFCGLELVHRSGFMSESLSEYDWNIVMVARKKG